MKQSPPAQRDLININLGNVQNGTVTLANATLSECLQFAFGLVSAEQVSGPDWIHARSTRFDIVAKTGAGTALEFEVAWVKAAAPDARGTMINIGNGMLTVKNATLKQLEAMGYSLRKFQITGGPGWIANDRWLRCLLSRRTEDV